MIFIRRENHYKERVNLILYIRVRTGNSDEENEENEENEEKGEKHGQTVCIKVHKI